MSFLRIPFAVLLLAATVSAAELRTLDGQTLSGDLVRISDKEIVLRTEGKEVATPIEQVLGLDLKQPGKVTAASYSAVELIDGSVLACSQFTPKAQTAHLTLVSGQETKVPLDTVAHVYKDAQDPATVAWWKEKAAKKRNSDLLGVRNAAKVLEELPGTFGDADADGKTIKFDVDSANNPRDLKLDRVAGILFLRRGAALPKETKCRLTDTSGNLLMVAEVQTTPNGYRFTTPVGATVEYAAEALARLDYSKGKLAFLSDLEPLAVVEKFALERFGHYRKDKNLDGGPLRLKNQVYSKGLSVPATTELQYNLEGEYREFRAVVGIDDLVGGSEAATTLRVEGDGKELLAVAVSRKEGPKPIALNVKGVQKLKIIVASDGLIDLGKHLDLADAKVSK